MQCGCPSCGVTMAWAQKGLDSRCVCPWCGHECSACLGTNSVLSKEAIAAAEGLFEPPAFGGAADDGDER